MRIPQSFKLFASTITVEFDNKRMNQTERYGESSYGERKIRLSTTQGVDGLAEDGIMDTFYHEKVHMILNTMCRDELSSDEEFVDVFAKLLRQADETAVYSWEDMTQKDLV